MKIVDFKGVNMAVVYKGDDTGAFSNNLLTIRANIPEGQTVSKAKLKIGSLPVMTFDAPTFPIVVNLTPAQTRQLQQQNTVYMAVFDELGRKATCRGTVTFVAKDEVV